LCRGEARVDLLALSVTVFGGADAPNTAEPTNEIAENEPGSAAAPMVQGALLRSTACVKAVGYLAEDS
jgi:hypothetical protein